MTHELQIRKEIADLQKQRSEHQRHLRYIDHLLNISKWLTFGLYLAFTLSLYLGDILHIQTLITSFLGSMPGFIFYLVICIALAYVLAGIKHAAYSHFAMFGVVAAIVVVVIAMGLMAEVFQSSGNQDTKARAIAQSNPEYQRIVNTRPADTLRVDTGISSMIATAEQKLARCKEKLAKGKEKHCKGDQARLDSLKASQVDFMNQQRQVAESITQAQFNRIDQLKTESYNPVIRSIASMTGVELASAIALIMFFIAANFEILHYFLSNMKAKTLHAIRRLTDAIRDMEVQYFQVAGVEFDGSAHTPPPANTDRPRDWAPFGKAKPATTETTTPPVRFKYQQQDEMEEKHKDTSQGFVGFVNPNKATSKQRTTAQATSAEHPNHHRTAADKKPLLGKAETQLDIPQLSTYNRELDNHGVPSPADKALNQTANKADIQRIIDKGLQTEKPTVDSIDVNRRVDTADNRRVDRINVDSGGLLAALKNAKDEVERDILKEGFALYGAWKRAILDKETTLSKLNGRKFISKHLCKARKKTMSPDGMDKLMDIWYAMSLKDTAILNNPKYTGRPPHPKYILNPDYQGD